MSVWKAESGLPKPEKPSNIALKSVMGRGDVAAAFKAADVIIEGRYETAAVHQGYIEPHACLVAHTDGKVTVYDRALYVNGVKVDYLNKSRGEARRASRPSRAVVTRKVCFSRNFPAR